MERENRRAVWDSRLGIRAYRLAGVARSFPNHFHEYYVLGLMEAGERVLSCKGREQLIRTGDVLLLGPGDSHACAQRGGTPMDFRGIAIPAEGMLELAERVTGRRELPGFSRVVLRDGEAACRLETFHRLVLEDPPGPGREEELRRLLTLLLERWGQPPASGPDRRREVEEACAFLERHLGERVSLDQLCRRAGLSRSTLLRAFARTKGVTPYRYLENLRVARAGELLEQGIPPAEVALRTGFSDQSHLTNCFGRFTGLSPGAYQAMFTEKEGS